MASITSMFPNQRAWSGQWTIVWNLKNLKLGQTSLKAVLQASIKLTMSISKRWNKKHTNIPCKIRQQNVPWCRPRSFHRKLYRGTLKKTRLWPSALFWWLQEAVCHCCSHPKPEKSAHEAKCDVFWWKNCRFLNKIFTCISTPGTSEAERMLIVSIPRVTFL